MSSDDDGEEIFPTRNIARYLSNKAVANARERLNSKEAVNSNNDFENAYKTLGGVLSSVSIRNALKRVTNQSSHELSLKELCIPHLTANPINSSNNDGDTMMTEVKEQYTTLPTLLEEEDNPQLMSANEPAEQIPPLLSNSGQEVNALKAQNEVIGKILEAEKAKVVLLESDNRALFDNYQLVKDQLLSVYAMSDHQHTSNTQTLDLLRTQLDEIKQERDTYKKALTSVKQSVASLMPLIPSIQSMADTTSSPSVLPSGVTTPSTVKVVAVAHSIDSGLSSQQPSVSRINEGAWLSPRVDGSVLRRLRSNEVGVADLSITQINEENEEHEDPAHLTHPPYPSDVAKEKMAPELSIVHIDQSDSSIVIPPVIPSDVRNEVQGIQAMINHLHQSIDELIRGCGSSTTLHDSPPVDQEKSATHVLRYNQRSGLNSDRRVGDDVSVELEKANDKISSLIDQVEEMKAKNDELNLKAVDEVTLLQERLMSAENELNAQRKLNNDLKGKKELLELDMARKFESTQKDIKALEVKLADKTKQAHDYQRMCEVLRVKETTIDSLQEEVSQLKEQLMMAQHQLATVEDNTDGVLLEKQLQSEQRINEELQTHLNKAVESIQEQSKEFSEREDMLGKEMLELKMALNQKESLIDRVKSEKESIDEQCVELKQQVITLTDQVNELHEGLKSSNDKVSRLCTRLEEKDEFIEELNNEQTLLKENITQLQAESKRHLTVYEQSVVRIQQLQEQLENQLNTLSDRERDIEKLTIANGELKQKLADSNQQLNDKDEQMAVKLQEALEKTQQELMVITKQQSALRETHVSELNQMEAKLKAEHAGRVALLKLQYTEKLKEMEHNEISLLNKIAELAPQLEKDSDEVRSLCKKVDRNKMKQLFKEKQRELEHANRLTDTLSQDNDQLKKRLSEGQEIVATLEQSMKAAQSTITELKGQLERIVSEKEELTDALQQQKEAAESEMEALQERILKSEESCANLRERNAQLVRTIEQDEANTSRDTLTKCLEGERAAVNELTLKLQATESNAATVTDQYLQEKALSNQLKHEVSSLCSKLEQREEELLLLQSDHANKLDELLKEKHKLVAKLQSKAKKHRDSEIKVQLREYKHRCKSLIFQKKYLTSEIDAFYHCHHGALLLINEMGGAVPRHHLLSSFRCNKPATFKIVALAVLSVIRMRGLTKKHHKVTRSSTVSPISLSSRCYGRSMKATPVLLSPGRDAKATPLLPPATPLLSSPGRRQDDSNGRLTIVMSKQRNNEHKEISAYIDEIRRIQEEIRDSN